ncbi:hypothetical protein D9758_011884 [Tetrapyrgos nigripes]|uniref:FAD binding domain-containing protein n=1 Tax=Tetrapyrgos nigripes TaxID=182062 RepID=A0A8H5CSD1_9AGAR|nr:hypothetical protein D9758_011884 [Tetrapyrgos nigripes]
MADPNAEPTLEAVTKMLQEAFHPFTMTWEEVNWFTIYKVGQRIASQFDVDRKIFLAGDASHIHSPKAGLGMNTSMMDTHNLAVKLALVLNKVAKPDILATYNLERKRVADQLLAMDAKLIDLFAKHSEAVKNSSKDAQSAAAATNNELFKFQRSQAAYQTGLSITYDESFLVRSPGPNDGPSETVREMGGHGLIPGRRLLPVTVTRYLDGCAMRLLEATQPFDGHFTIFLCLGDLFSPGKMERIQQLKTQIMRPDGLWKRLLDQRYANLSGQLLDSESLFPRSSQHPVFRFVVITSTRNDSMELARHYENIFRPKNSTDPLLFGPEMLFCDNIPAIFYGVDPANMPLEPRILKKPLHEKWDVSEEEGAVVVLRPDGHVGAFVRNLLDRDRYSGSGWSSVEEYFSRFLVLDD